MLAERFALMVNRAMDHFSEGYTVLLQKRNTFKGSALADGGGAAPLKAPNSSAMVSSLTLTSTAIISGVLFSGSTFSIAGDSTTYTLTAGATASGHSITVHFSPVLQLPTNTGQSVTVSNPSPVSFNALSGNIKEIDLKTLELVRPRKIYLSPWGVNVAPAVNDLITDNSGTDAIQIVSPLSPGAGQMGWSVIIGGKV